MYTIVVYVGIRHIRYVQHDLLTEVCRFSSVHHATCLTCQPHLS